MDNVPEQEEHILPFRPDTPSPPTLYFEEIPRSFRVYRLIDEDLDRFSSSYSSHSQTFFGVAFGTALTAAVTLMTTQPSTEAVAILVGLMFPAAVLAVSYFDKMRKEQRAADDMIRRIREGRATTGTGPRLS